MILSHSLRREWLKVVRRFIMKVYHVTDKKRLKSILKKGLLTNQKSNGTAGRFVEEIRTMYNGMIPIFVSVDMNWLYESLYFEEGRDVMLEIEVDRVIADIPSLMDCGAYYDENGIYFHSEDVEDGQVDLLEKFYVDGHIPYEDLVLDKELISECIRRTMTCAILNDVSKLNVKVITD
jgi:hypothetical protein